MTSSDIFFELKSSTLVPDLYGLCNVYYAYFYPDHTVNFGKALFYHKRAFIWSLIYVCSVVSEHAFIYHFIVIVKSMFILTGVIYINLRLFLMTY